MMLSDYISTFGVIAVAIYLVYKEYRSGDAAQKSQSNLLASQVVTNYKTLDEQQKQQLAEKDAAILKYQQDMAEIKSAMATMKESFAKDIGKLQGELKAKDEQITLLQQTILDKNPEMVTLLKDIRNFMQKIDNANTHQTQILETGAKRNQKIDDATAHEAGKVLRKE